MSSCRLLYVWGSYHLGLQFAMLFTIRQETSIKFAFPFISRSSYWGGTGKTPMIDTLRRLCNSMSGNFEPGLRRRPKGFISLTQDSAKNIGDEPFQFFVKIGGQGSVAVGESGICFPILQNYRKPRSFCWGRSSIGASKSLKIAERVLPAIFDDLLCLRAVCVIQREAVRADLVLFECPEELSDEYDWNWKASGNMWRIPFSLRI